MGVFGRRVTDAQRAEELFSPYIDGQVTAEEKEFLERYLADHREAREKFEMLKTAVQLTRSLPPLKAPRSFVLPRSMARRPGPALRLYPAMRLATVAAMALFAFALAGDLVTSSRLVSTAPPASVPLSAKAMATAAPEQPSPAAAAELPAEAPAPATTATPIAAPTQAATAREAATSAGAPEATPQPPAAAGAAAPTESALSQSDAARAADFAATPEATAAQSDVAMQASESQTASPAPVAQPIDALRLAVIGLAGLSLALGATTLIVRRRIR